MDIAVVIPTRDRPSMLRESLLSMLRQSLPASEIVVVDDGRDPRTTQVCVETAPQARVLSSGERGISFSNNLGVAAVRADYVALQADDDVALHDRLERHAAAFARGADVAYGGWINVDDTTAAVAFATGHPRVTLDALLTQGACVSQGAAAYRTQTLRRFPYDETLLVGADMESHARMLAAGVVFEHTGSFTLLRRLHALSMTQLRAREQRDVKVGLQRLRDAEVATDPEAVDANGRVETSWTHLREAMAQFGLDASALRLGRRVTTLKEAALLARQGGLAYGAVEALNIGSFGEAMARLSPRDDRLSLGFREKLTSARVETRDAAPLTEQFGLGASGGRVLIGAPEGRFMMDDAVALQHALQEMPGEWRFLALTSAAREALKLPFSLAVASNRLSTEQRLANMVDAVRACVGSRWPTLGVMRSGEQASDGDESDRRLHVVA